ncbi:hypothetical protein AV530_016606 [Patagioenas fasciata monilis]|uniref:Uncharacterized protein n=1 Tax=Patagioenas fasciata monilis TaxID=372326 RepID=A0A1V4J343_PATFA|nr:hypothetical protein AV530_016606 [Patagioenas fasciata monilis]
MSILFIFYTGVSRCSFYIKTVLWLSSTIAARGYKHIRHLLDSGICFGAKKSRRLHAVQEATYKWIFPVANIMDCKES